MAQWIYSKDPSLIGKFTSNGQTPLHLAAAVGRLDVVQWLCTENPEQLLVKWVTEIPYKTALRYNQTEVANWLKASFPEACKEKEDGQGRCIIS